MKLKTKVLLASSLVVLGVLGTAEWIGFRQTSLFLNAHETNMATEMNHGLALAELRQGGQVLLSRLATLHLIHGILTVTALVVALNMVWSRTVLGPLTELLRHYQLYEARKLALPVRRDEIGELTAAFNDLGGQLTMTVHQFAATSKLSGMALFGTVTGEKGGGGRRSHTRVPNATWAAAKSALTTRTGAPSTSQPSTGRRSLCCSSRSFSVNSTCSRFDRLRVRQVAGRQGRCCRSPHGTR